MNTERKVPVVVESTWIRSPFGPYTGLLFTSLFALGSLLIIFFWFLPMIDEGRIATFKAQITLRDDQESQADARVQEQINTLKLDERDAEELRKKRREDHNKWQEEDRVKLEQQIHDAQLSQVMSAYKYRWGMIVGFVLLVFAGLGYLHFGQTPAVRIVGAIVVTAMLLFIFLNFLSPRHTP